MTMQATTEFVATSEEAIQAIATDLASSDRKYKVFTAVYGGGNQPKDAPVLASKTGLSEVAVLQLATPMAHRQYFERVKLEGRVAFKKYPHINAVRHKILKRPRIPCCSQGMFPPGTQSRPCSCRPIRGSVAKSG